MKNRQFEEILLKIHKKKCKTLDKKIKAIYKEAFHIIDDETSKLWLEMLSQGQVSASLMFRLERWNKLQGTIEQQMADIGQAQQEVMQLTLLDAYKAAYTKTNDIIEPGKEYTIFNENIAKKIVDSNFKGATISERIKGATSKTGQQIQSAIISTAIAGKDYRAVSKELAKRLSVSRSAAETIVRTETMRVINEAQKQSYKDKGYQKIIWLAELDERTCTECKAIDGKEYDIDKAPSILHPRCRCTCYPKL